MRIVITGAGVAGLIAAQFLARTGHDVIILERDATPLPADPDAAFHWNRRGAPQVRHPHAFLGRLRNLLRDGLPDVREDLLAAGAVEVNWLDIAPDTLDDRTPQPGDEDLALIGARRTTFEWVLRRAALRTDHVQLRDGVKVIGLVSEPGALAPRVTGVRTDAGVVEADLVVDASGRHSGIRTLLGDIGVTFPEEQSDTGTAYVSRFYRLLPGAEEPDKAAFTGGDLGYLGYGIFRGDNRTFSVTLAVGTDDPEMRAAVDAERFDVAAALLPAARTWLDPALAEPIADVHVMAGLINRIRHLVVDRKPLVLGYVAIGDALICTNPLYGRGCSLGGVHARLLADAVRDHGSDLAALALRLHDDAQREILPWYQASVLQDEASRAARSGQDVDPAVPSPSSIIREALLPLARYDALVARTFFRMVNLLATPDSLLANPEVLRRVMVYWAARDTRPPEPPLGPTRAEMLSALAAAREATPA